MIPRYFVVAESEHELQNPTSEEKLLLLGKRLCNDEVVRDHRAILPCCG